ncbi:MAG: type VI secretion system tube protein Hcp [Sphingobacteriales bacterium]|nr:type VI secretion system tube protein Hcp [Sphingobacteriales bacterium]
MRKIILLVLLLPVLISATAQDMFIKLTDPAGKQISGDVVVRAYEKWMRATSLTPGGKNNTQLSFTMDITGASAELKKAMVSGSFLLNGQVAVVKPGPGKPIIQYTISLEKMKVTTCSESMGCNGAMNTVVSITATRIGWTYYQQDRTGAQVISNKYGYDAETGGQWTNF